MMRDAGSFFPGNSGSRCIGLRKSIAAQLCVTNKAESSNSSVDSQVEQGNNGASENCCAGGISGMWAYAAYVCAKDFCKYSGPFSMDPIVALRYN
jgi:hypothetical protein